MKRHDSLTECNGSPLSKSKQASSLHEKTNNTNIFIIHIIQQSEEMETEKGRRLEEGSGALETQQ